MVIIIDIMIVNVLMRTSITVIMLIIIVNIVVYYNC